MNADAAAIPDPDVLAECLREGFDEVCSLANPEPKPKPARKKAPGAKARAKGE